MIKSRILNRLAVRRKHVSFGKSLHVGPFSRVWAPTGLTLGNDVYIGKHCTVECDGVIGDGVLIANAVGIVGRKDHNFRHLGTPVRMSSWVGHDPSLSSRVEISSDVWIGYGAVVLAPVKIGFGAIVAAGSVVVRDVPDFAIVAGSPAEVIGWRFEETGEQLSHREALFKLGYR